MGAAGKLFHAFLYSYPLHRYMTYVAYRRRQATTAVATVSTVASASCLPLYQPLTGCFLFRRRRLASLFLFLSSFFPVLFCAQNPDETAGWPAALRYLRAALVEHAPIDGLLGFSQGATVAAVLAAATAEPPPPADLPPSSQVAGSLAAPITPAAPEAAVAETAALARLRLVIVVSGFAPWRDHLAGLLSPDRPLDLPSLHIMGEADTQVPVAACRALAECFAPTQREVYVHGGGHLVPSGADARARVVSFVARFAKGEGATGRNAHL